MKRCLIEKENEPPCEETLDEGGMCRVHCRALVRTCNVCQYRYTREDSGLEACPNCTKDRHCSNRHRKRMPRCRMHGGSSRAGISSPRLKDGERSRYLDVLDRKSQKDYRRAQESKDKLSLEEDIDLLDYRVRKLISGEPSREWYREITETFEQFAAAQAAMDRVGSIAALQQLATLIRGGEDEAKRWKEIDKLAWQRRPRIVLTETRRKVHLAEMVQSAIVFDLLKFVVESIRRNVKDVEALNTINTDIRRGVSGTFLQLAGSGRDDGEVGGD